MPQNGMEQGHNKVAQPHVLIQVHRSQHQVHQQSQGAVGEHTKSPHLRLLALCSNILLQRGGHRLLEVHTPVE